ncbi:MAG: SMC-Scp complex subunit ScpB [Spirochaetes bacterium]|nr:SMC-Scp complex subunit ScpB [Spirochaetota bacterium]
MSDDTVESNTQAGTESPDSSAAATTAEGVAATESVLENLEEMHGGGAPGETPESEEAEAAPEKHIPAEVLADPVAASKIVEAIIFIEGTVTLRKLHRILSIDTDAIRAIIRAINERHAASGGLEIIEIGDSVRMIAAQSIFPHLSKVYGKKKKTTLSRTILQALAIIAYKQPVTKAEIDDVRQADSAKQLRYLMEEGFVEFKGRKDILNKPQTYGTTDLFLIHFGLASLDDLPKLRELKELEFNRAD